MSFAEILKALRTEMGLTQAQCAKELGIALRTYASYESGATVPRNRAVYDRAAKLFGIDAKDLQRAGLRQQYSDAAIDMLDITAEVFSTMAGRSSSLAKLVSRGVQRVYGRSGTASGDKNSSKTSSNDSGEATGRKAKITVGADGASENHFRAIADGLVFRALSSQGIACSMEPATSGPDRALNISGQSIKRIELYYEGSAITGENADDCESLRLLVLLGMLAEEEADSSKEAVFVIGEEALYDKLTALKNHNSYRGNLLAVLMDKQRIALTKEDVIATFDNETDGASLIRFL